MKKIISSILCVMMLVSLLSVSVSASITTDANTICVAEDDFEGTTITDVVFEKATLSDDGTYYVSNHDYKAFAQPVAYPVDHAYTIQFDSKFQTTDGTTRMVEGYVLDKNITADIPEVTTSMDFYIRGDVNPEAKGIDVSKWYTFRITIDKAAGIAFNGYHGRLQGNGIKLEWKEAGTDVWKVATNAPTDWTDAGRLEANFGGEELKFYVGRNIWQYTGSSDMETDGFGFQNRSYLANFKVNYGDASFAGAVLQGDAEGSYAVNEAYKRMYLQPVNYPENGAYTVEFDSKFINTADGAAQKITVFLLDPNIVEAVNSSYVESSLDFEIMGHEDMEAKGIDKDKWYSFRITVDVSKGIAFSGYYGRLYGDGIILQWKERGADTWKTAVTGAYITDYTGEELKYIVSRNYWQYVNPADKTTPGFGVQQNVCLDNFKVEYKEPIPTSGVLFIDDFEGATVLGVPNSQSIAVVESEKGNSYMKLYSDGTTWKGSSSVVPVEIPENFIFTMDVYKEKDNEQSLLIEYWQSDVMESGVWGQIGIFSSQVEAEKWYRVKIAKNEADRKYAITIEDLETGEITAVPSGGQPNLAIEVTGKQPGKFMFRGFKNDTILNWRVDNIVMTKAAAASIPALVAEDGSVTAEISADAMGEKVTPVIALYKADRLVSVDWNTADVKTDGAVEELAASGDYDTAKILLWDTFEGNPIGEAWDITEYLAK